MELIELVKREDIEPDKKLATKYHNFEKLIVELKKRQIPPEIAEQLNRYFETINRFAGTNQALLKHLRNTQPKILNLLDTKLKLATKNYYRQKWLAIGLSVIGVTFGAVFGAIMKNMAFLGIGIPIGMLIGLAIGINLDKKAFEKGTQLDVRMNY